MTRETLSLRAGLTVEQIAAFEGGATRIDAVEMREIAKALGVKIHELFGHHSLAPVPESRAWIRDVERWFGVNLSPYERDFLGLARRLTGDIDSARDLVHDAYARILSGGTWVTLTHPRAYVMRAVYNLGLNKLRNARVVPMQQYAKTETVSYADLSPDQFQVLSGRQEIDLLMSAISQLPPQCRKVVIMRRINEMRPRDIAQKLGISLSTVEKHLARGMVLLADYLDASRPEQTDLSSNTAEATKPE
jgi:RNA polymerase sigma-70 factor (ECF subfamily)